MHGEKEQKCLDFVKENINFVKYYGFSENDILEFEACLNSAKTNANVSKFPDFICDDGFIEHFQISSGKLTKKGSEHLKDINIHKNNINNILENDIKNNNIRPRTFKFNYNSHSYKNLIISLENSWNSHLKSLEKYNIEKSSKGIFMIQYTDAAITMCENPFANIKKELIFADLIEQKYIDYYSLCRDKRALDFIYKNKDKIHYVVYVYNSGIEVINTNNIPEIKKLLPWDYCIAAYKVTIATDTYIPKCEDNKNE